MKLKWWYLLGLIVFFFGVGSIVVVLRMKPSQPNLSEILRDSEIVSIEIKVYWTGLSESAPLEAYYSLHPDEMGYIGQANFKVGDYSGEPMTETETVQISVKDMQSFYKN